MMQALVVAHAPNAHGTGSTTGLVPTTATTTTTTPSYAESETESESLTSLHTRKARNKFGSCSPELRTEFASFLCSSQNGKTSSQVSVLEILFCFGRMPCQSSKQKSSKMMDANFEKKNSQMAVRGRITTNVSEET